MTTKEKEKELENIPYDQQKVSIKIPLTRDQKDDVFVGVNGKTWLIKRGVTVEVPRYVADLIERSESQAEANIAALPND